MKTSLTTKHPEQAPAKKIAENKNMNSEIKTGPSLFRMEQQ